MLQGGISSYKLKLRIANMKFLAALLTLSLLLSSAYAPSPGECYENDCTSGVCEHEGLGIVVECKGIEEGPGQPEWSTACREYAEGGPANGDFTVNKRKCVYYPTSDPMYPPEIIGPGCKNWGSGTIYCDCQEPLCNSNAEVPDIPETQFP